MGWGRYYGGYSRGRQPGKKETARELSAATLQKIVAEKEAAARMSADRDLRLLETMQKRAQEEAEERALEEKHGGKEALAKWRAENADTLWAAKLAAYAKARQAAVDRAIIDQIVTLQAELATFGPLDLQSARQDLSALVVNKAMVTAKPRARRAFSQPSQHTHFSCLPSGSLTTHLAAANSSQAKTTFHLNDREIEALPKDIVQKEGTKRPSKITMKAKDIFEACIAKGTDKATLRKYQRAAFPNLARLFVESELLALDQKYPGFKERSREHLIGKLVEADGLARAAVASAEAKVAAAQMELVAAHHKAGLARKAVESVADSEELHKLMLPALGGSDAGSSLVTPATSHVGNVNKRLKIADADEAAAAALVD